VFFENKTAIMNFDCFSSSEANITRSSNGRIDWLLEPGYARTVHPINTPLCEALGCHDGIC